MAFLTRLWGVLRQAVPVITLAAVLGLLTAVVVAAGPARGARDDLAAVRSLITDQLAVAKRQEHLQIDQLAVANNQLDIARQQLSVAHTQLEVANAQLDIVRSQEKIARDQLDITRAQLDLTQMSLVVQRQVLADTEMLIRIAQDIDRKIPPPSPVSPLPGRVG